MKPSRRNRKKGEQKQDRSATKPPPLSKYAAKVAAEFKPTHRN